MTEHPVQTVLAKLVNQALALTDDHCFRSEYDDEWLSPCELTQVGTESLWRPISQSPMVDFSGLANAVESPIHPSIQAFYQAYWAGTIETISSEGQVSLIQLWNEEDFERLIGNLIGHYMSKKRIREPFTVFFATTEPDSEYFLSVDNSDGKVLLEEPGNPPLRVVEENLHTFLARLTPVNRQPDIY